jgi:hypothetical protein
MYVLFFAFMRFFFITLWLCTWLIKSASFGSGESVPTSYVLLASRAAGCGALGRGTSQAAELSISADKSFV